MRSFFFIIIFFLFCTSSYGQSISGVVREKGQLVSDRFVQLFQDSTLVVETTTNFYGKFKFKKLNPGKYRVCIEQYHDEDYNKVINIVSDKVMLEVQLESIITSCGFGERITIHPLKTHILTQRSNSIIVDQYSKDIAGTFGDPSRVLLRHTGISTQNDQANGIVYRGLPSENINWTISGAEIVNPNHLSNAGTLSDQSSASAGGVLAFPMETIHSFQFSGQPYSSRLPNALGGVADLHFGNGDFRRDNSFFKLGLLGLEAGYANDGKVKVKAHARYSTVGLLSDLGVDFDGESIKFQDVFLNVGITKYLQYIGLLANSTNDKVAIENPTPDATRKDLSQINYQSEIMIHGLQYRKYKHNHSLFFSTKKDSRDVLFDDVSTSTLSKDMKLSYHGEYRLNNFKTGLNASYYNGLQSFEISVFDDDYLTIQPYVTYNKMKNFDGKSFNINSSLALFYDTYNQELTIEPYLQLQYSTDPIIIELNASQKSQMLSPFLYGLAFVTTNLQLDRSKTASTSLSLKWKKEKYRLLTRAFYQYLYDLPAAIYPTGILYSPVMNGIDFSVPVVFDQMSHGETYGIEMMADFDLGSDLYLNANATFFNATYEGFNATNNFGQIYNLTITKEFGDHFLINFACHYRGGAYENQPFHEQIYQRQLSDYYRIDMRVAYEWKQKNELTLDIQNVTNRLNDAYYNAQLNSMPGFGTRFYTYTLEKQLGLIPILSYKRILN